MRVIWENLETTYVHDSSESDGVVLFQTLEDCNTERYVISQGSNKQWRNAAIVLAVLESRKWQMQFLRIWVWQKFESDRKSKIFAKK